MSESAPLTDGAAGISRRTALKIGAVGLIGVAVGAGSTAAIARLSKQARPRWRFLTEPEAALLAEICGQIIPRDDVPGAAETGGVDYIDRQLCGPYMRLRGAYRAGLESFSRTCQRVFRAPFAELSGTQKIAALRLVETGGAPGELWGDPPQSAFFNMVLAHTMQGFYGSPRHGGDRDYASYRMLGLDYPQVVGQNRYAKA